MNFERGVIHMGATSQRKGRTAERELARILQSYGYPVEAAEPLNYGTIPDLVGLNNVHIEVKRHEKLCLSEWLRQAERDSEKFGDGIPAVFHRCNREEWRVTMSLKNWLSLYEGVQKRPAPSK